MILAKQRGTFENVLVKIPLALFSVVTVFLPAFSLALCFWTAFMFRFEEVNETMCDVKNYLPSVSGVTGITPQTYLWRACVALHSAPRLLVATMYFNDHMSRLNRVDPQRRSLFEKLTRLNYWLNFIEDSCLLLVTCISNKENYPVHEKLFVGFMVTSLCYMLLNLILFSMARTEADTENEKRSLWWKKAMFFTNLSATAGLIFFFILHRFYCVNGAFSFFSGCEYVIAYSNMAYHFTGHLDFKGKYLMFGNFTADESSMNGSAASTNNNKLKEKDQ